MTWSQYAAAWADQHGGYDPRRAATLPRRWHRFGYTAASGLARLGVPPGLLTAAGLAGAVAVVIAAPRGPAGLLAAAVLFLLVTAAATLARGVGLLGPGIPAQVVIREAAADRLAEVCLLAGFWAAGAPAVLALGCGVLTGLHEYVREQALGVRLLPPGTQTAGERPTRTAIAVGGLMVAAFSGELAPGLLTLTLAVWAVVAVIGLQQLATALRHFGS